MPRSRSRSRNPSERRHRRDSPHRSRHRGHSSDRRRSRSRDRRGGGDDRVRVRDHEPRHSDRRYRSRSHSRSRGRGGGEDHYHRAPRAGAEQQHRHEGRPVGYSRDGGRHGEPPAAQLSLEPPPVGAILRGRVVSVRPFGVFVQLDGFRKQGMVHSSQVSSDVEFSREDDDELKVKALEFYCTPGSQVWAKVLEVRADEGGGGYKVACSLKAVDQETGKDLDPDNLMAERGGPGGRRGGDGAGAGSMEPPPLHSIHRGVVKGVRPFGVFVEMEGYRNWGLVHSSQVSDYLGLSREDTDEEKVATLSGVVSEGDSVWVKVVEVRDPEFPGAKTKVSCSMKVVNQRSGEDEDPSNSRYRPRDAVGGGGGDGGPGAAGVARVVEGGKIDWGHLKGGDTKYGDPKRRYDYVSDEEGEPPLPPPPPGNGSAAALPPPPPGPMGRGRGSVLPAWMTNPGGPRGDGMVPSESPRDAPAAASGLPAGIGSVEEALSILAKFAGGKGKKEKKGKKDKKGKKQKKGKDKSKKKKDRKQRSRSSGSDSSSDND